MAQNKRKTTKSSGKRTRAAKSAGAKKPIRREVGGVVCLALAVLSVLACFGVRSLFTDWLRIGGLGLFGIGFYMVPFALLLACVVLFFHDGRPVQLRVTCALLIPIFLGMILHLTTVQYDSAWAFPGTIADLWQQGNAAVGGGVICGLLAMALKAIISQIGAMIVLIVLTLFALLTALNMTVAGIVKAFSSTRPRVEYDPPKYEHPDPAQELADRMAQRRAARAAQKRRDASAIDLPVDDPVYQSKDAERAAQKEKKVQSPDEYLRETMGITPEKPAAVDIKPVVPVETPIEPLHEEPKKVRKEDIEAESNVVAAEIEEKNAETQSSYQFPTLDLLNEGTAAANDGSEEMRVNTERLNGALQSFGIEGHIVNVVRGPAVTRYELELDRGVKLSRVTNLSDDIALALGASGVRISAIPDKISIVGIEVPNKAVASVSLRDVLKESAFTQNKSTISFAVGKDIGGNAIVGDIAALPHLLIAGTTGSGKSVCINSLIVSLLYKAKPDEVRMIMVDPKMVELGVYNDIPHLLIPVVTDPKKAAGALQWGVHEMLRRYRMMADANVRDLKAYNQLAASNSEYEPMPQIVVVIDELADLMMAAAKEVEDSICRIAQMGRAAGLHLVIATQRPSADVITGLMKANIPSRIAFAVASAMESRIILDAQGAEKLVGKGDMLYAPLGAGKPKRVQGCYISDSEVQRVVNAIGKNAVANYDSEVAAQIEKNMQSGGKNAPTSAGDTPAAESDCDELLEQAVEIVLETGQASTSMLQRRLKLGYARAARIVDEMEERGIVGPFSGSKPRELLITKEQWDARKTAAENPPVDEEI